MQNGTFILAQWLALNGRSSEDFARSMGITLTRAEKLIAGTAWPKAREAYGIRQLTGLSIDNWIPSKPPEF